MPPAGTYRTRSWRTSRTPKSSATERRRDTAIMSPVLPPSRTSRSPEGRPERWANRRDVVVTSVSARPMMRRIKPSGVGVVKADARGKATHVPIAATRRKAPPALRFSRNGDRAEGCPADLKRGHFGGRMAQITYDDFAKVDIRVGRIVQAD